MRDTLENLYFGKITPNEQDITPGSVLAGAMDRAEQCEEKLTALLEELLERRRGDIFAAFLDLFDRIQAEYRDPEKKERYQHIMGVVRNNSGAQLTSLLGMECCLPVPGRLVEWVDPRLLDLRSAGDLENMFHILMGVAGQAVLRGIQAEDPAEVRGAYLRTLDILRRGMERKQPEAQPE